MTEPTDKAWLAGWDAGICGRGSGANPYRRRPQVRAWEFGRVAGLRSNDDDVRILKLICNRRREIVARTVSEAGWRI